MEHTEYWIPKINVPITCHTVQGEKIEGEIFLDVILTEGYSVSQVQDFFNDHAPFFPIRKPEERPILLSRDSIVQVDIPQLASQFDQETSNFSTRKEAVLHLHGLGPVRALIVVDMPAEYSRILDLVNMAKRAFFPCLVNGSLALLSFRHIFKIEEP